MTNTTLSECVRENNRLHNTIQSLESELTTARERIEQLERCAVVGGDGQPLEIGKPIFVEESTQARTPAKAVSFYRQKTATGYEKCVNVIYKNGQSEGVEAIFCYSTSEAVPEGGKG